MAVLVAATLAALEQALRYNSIVYLGPCIPCRPSLSTLFAPLPLCGPSIPTGLEWPVCCVLKAPPSRRSRPDHRGPEGRSPHRADPLCLRLGLPEMKKSVLGAWPKTAAVEISFLSETNTPQSNQTQITIYEALLTHGWLISPGIQGAMVKNKFQE